MGDYDSFGERVLNALFVILWLLSRPFVWAYMLARWFVIAVAKEVGGRLVKAAGGVIAVAIIAGFVAFFFHR